MWSIHFKQWKIFTAQLLNRLKCTDPKIEASCKKFNNNKGRLSVDEFYNVIKLQNGVEVSKDEIRRLVADLDMDKGYKISIKVRVKSSES